VIPNLDSLRLIERVVADLLGRTNYAPIEIVIVDNGSTDKAVLAFYASLDRSIFTVDVVSEPFNFARMCNRGAALSKGDAILFLNNDVEVEDADWLAEMVECLSFDSTGIVGAKLVYPNGRVQHNGVIVGLGGAAGHWYIEAGADEPGPMGRLFVRQTLSAVTGACMLVTRRCFEAVKGFDEERFAVAYNDIDLCLRARAVGFRTVWTPFARLIHHESLTRGSDEHGPRQARFEIEKERLRERHGTTTFVDDAFSPFYDRVASVAIIKIPDALPAPRPNLFG
jgi:GT2 family glycosyltransferase